MFNSTMDRYGNLSRFLFSIETNFVEMYPCYQWIFIHIIHIIHVDIILSLIAVSKFNTRSLFSRTNPLMYDTYQWWKRDLVVLDRDETDTFSFQFETRPTPRPSTFWWDWDEAGTFVSTIPCKREREIETFFGTLLLKFYIFAIWLFGVLTNATATLPAVCHLCIAHKNDNSLTSKLILCNFMFNKIYGHWYIYDHWLFKVSSIAHRVYSIDKLTTPQLISASVIDSNVISTALPTFSRSQLNGTTVNTAWPNRKLVIRDGSHIITEVFRTLLLYKYNIATQSQRLYIFSSSPTSGITANTVTHNRKLVIQDGEP